MPKFSWINYWKSTLTPNLSPLARKFTTAPLTLDACTCVQEVKIQYCLKICTSACSPIRNMRISSQCVSRTSPRCFLESSCCYLAEKNKNWSKIRAGEDWYQNIKLRRKSLVETHLSELMIHLPPGPFFSSSQSGKMPSWCKLYFIKTKKYCQFIPESGIPTLKKL